MSNITRRKFAESNLKKQATELKTVAEVSVAVATTLDVQQLIEDIVDLTKTRFHLYQAQIYLLDSDHQSLVLAASSGEVGRELVKRGHQIHIIQQQSLVGRAAHTRRGVIVNNVHIDPGFLPNLLLPDTQSEMAIPIIAGEELLGVLDVQSERIGRFTRQDLDIQTTFASQIAVALQNAQTFSQLSERQIQLTEALQIAKMGGFEIDLETDVFSPGDELLTLLDLSVETKIDSLRNLEQNARKFLPIETIDEFKALLRNLSTTSEHSHIEHKFRILLNNKTHTMLARAKVLSDDSGHPIRIKGTIQDITEQVIAQEEISSLAAVIEQASETVVITDLNGTITYANPHFEDSTGYSISEALGENLSLLKSGEHEQDFYQVLWETIASGQTWQGTFINRRKDGALYYEAATIFPIRNSQGEIVNYAALKRDITSQVKADEAERSFAQQLSSLHEVSMKLSSAESFEAICQLAIELGKNTLKFDRIGLWFLDPEKPGYLRGSFCIDENGLLQDAHNQQVPSVTNPIHELLRSGKSRLYYEPNTALYNDHQEIIGHGDIAAAGLWDNHDIIGYIIIDNLLDQKQITKRQLELLNLFGQILGHLCTRKQTEQEIQDYAHQQRLLNDITRAAIENTNIPGMLQLYADILGKISAADSCSITILNHQTGKVELGAAYGPTRDQYDSIELRPYEQTLTRSVLELGQTLIIEDTQNSPSISTRIAEIIPQCSMLGVPLIANKQNLGTALIYFSEGQTFTSKEINRTEQAANQIALALSKAFLIESEQKQRQRAEKQAAKLRQRERTLRLLNEITLLASETMELPPLLQFIADRLGELINADGCIITLVDEKTTRVQTGAAYGPLGNQYIKLIPEPGEETMTEVVIESQHILVIEDITNSPYISTRVAMRFPARSLLGLPLIVGDQKLGAAFICFHQTHIFSKHEISICEQAAGQLALAIAKVQALETAKRRAHEAETLRQAGASITATLKQDEAIQRILIQLKSVVPYDSASVQLLNEDENLLEIVGDHGFLQSIQVRGMQFPLDGENPASEVFRTREPFILDDAQKDYSAFRTPSHNHIHGWMGIPLIVKERLIGMISLDSTELRRFSEEHARLAVAFANQAAVALENTLLYAEVQRLAITDSLTGLFNRRHFFNLADQEFERAYRYNRQLTFIMLDIDHFKKINDTYGHAIGDQVLQSLAALCHDTMRKFDILGRYGGEELILLLPETDLKLAELVAERLRRTIEETQIETNAGQIAITVSMGLSSLAHIAIKTKATTTDLERLIDQADQALYTAKQLGRNKVVTWERAHPDP